MILMITPTNTYKETGVSLTLIAIAGLNYCVNLIRNQSSENHVTQVTQNEFEDAPHPHVAGDGLQQGR